MSTIKEFIKKNNYIYKKTKEIYFLVLKTRDWFERILFSPFLLLSVNNNKIIASSYFGKGFGDNPGEIIRYMYETYGGDFRYFWVVKNKEVLATLPRYVIPIKLGSAKYYYHMSTSKIWIDNCRKNRYPFKRKEQIYIQTWHGGISFKRIEKDAEENLPSYYTYNAKRDSKIVDYMTSNSNFQTEMIKRAFWYDGKILEIGSPRLDPLFKQDYVKKKKSELKNIYNIDSSKNIILYAPTFRNSHSLESYIQDYKYIVQRLECNYIFLVRLHPNMSYKSSQIEFDDYIIDVTNYPNMYDLMALSDVLITDYSSSMFEFAILGKPVILFAKDYESYSSERGSYFNADTIPFPIVDNEQELVNIILQLNSVKSQKNFINELHTYETGNASSILVNTIIEDIRGEKDGKFK